MNKIAIVLINYKQAELTIECINSIKESTFKDYSIIVVDNNSQDNSISILKKVSNINLIEAQENKGFSSGCNIGINYAIEKGAKYILLLNNDTVIDKNMLKNLIDNIDDNSVCTPKMYYYKNKNVIWYAGGKIDKKKGLAKHIGIDCIDSEKYDRMINIDFVTGCCILIPVPVIKQIGLLDEEYFMYCEDFEYSLRLKKNGIIMKYIPTAKLWHKVGASSGNKSKINEYYSNRNRFYILNKYNFGFIAWCYTIITRILRYMHGIIKNTNEKMIYKAWKDYKNNRMGKVDL